MYLDLVEFLQREHHRFIPYRRVDLSWFRREISLEACNSLIHYGTGRHYGYEILFSLFNERRTQIKPLNSKTGYMNIWYDTDLGKKSRVQFPKYIQEAYISARF